MVYLIYLVLAAIVVFVSIKCAYYVDLIDKKTNLSGAFIGGVILAAVTSMPELMTSITAITVVKNPGLVMGNVLGSNIFNLCILAGLVLMSASNFIKAKIADSHKVVLVCTLFVYAILTVVITLNKDFEFFKISIASVLLLVIYIISLKFLAGDDTENEEEDTSTLTVKQIIFRFIMATIVLIISSIAVTYVADIISTKLNLGASLGGALFLGIATSLPELSSSIALVHKKNFNAMVGNIVGSNMFNYLILVVGDVIYRGGSIYHETAGSQTNILILFGFISSVFVGIMLVLQSRNRKKALLEENNSEENVKKKSPAKWIFYALSVGVILSYFAFLILSMYFK